MPTNVSRMNKVPEQKLLEIVKQYREIDEADIVTAFRDNEGTFTIDATVIIIDHPNGLPGTVISRTGKMSIFGGPNDQGVGVDEGLALYTEEDVAANPNLFLAAQPDGTSGLARRLNPNAMYVACRWDYSVTPKDYLRKIKVRVTANDKSLDAIPVDFGPSDVTGRVADLSPGLATALLLNTDDTCTLEIPPPLTGVAVGVDLAAIDNMLFPSGITRSLVAMTTLNNSTYWVVDQVGPIGGGQTLLRRVGTGAPEVLLSDTTVFPIQESDQVTDVVAGELNKAIVNEAPLAQAASDGAPKTGDDINAKVFAKAKGFVGYDTSKVPGTEGGNLACAWAVNEVVRLAVGKPISSDGNGNNGLGTDGIFDALKKFHTQVQLPSPGSIVISPTPPDGTVHGHVGIVGQNPAGPATNTQIFSNSSGQKKFAQNRTIQSWTDYYSGQLHLDVLFFNLNIARFLQV